MYRCLACMALALFVCGGVCCERCVVYIPRRLFYDKPCHSYVLVIFHNIVFMQWVCYSAVGPVVLHNNVV